MGPGQNQINRKQQTHLNIYDSSIKNNTFAPTQPNVWKKKPNEWLTSIDILNVMKQYEDKYDDFEFLGPSPIDFDTHKMHGECVWDELCKFSLKKSKDDGENILIRPLAYCSESDLIQLASDYSFPVVPCNLCGTQENLQRQEMKSLLKKLELKHPNIGSVMLNAQGNVRPSQLADHKLWDFSSL